VAHSLIKKKWRTSKNKILGTVLTVTILQEKLKKQLNYKKREIMGNISTAAGV
jgi:hypothetical protein